MSDLEDQLLAEIRLAGLPLPEREYRIVPGRLFRADFAWPDRKLYAEVDGGTWVYGRHSRPLGVEKDAEKQSLAAIHGWRGMRFTNSMVKDGRALQLIEQALSEAA